MRTQSSWAIVTAAVGLAGVAALLVFGERLPPALARFALGVGVGSLIVALRIGQRFLAEGREAEYGSALLDAPWQLPLEWLLASGLLTSVLFLADAWPLPAVLLALPLVAAFPTFDHVVRPMLLATRHDLTPAPAALRGWLETMSSEPVRVDVYEGRLWNAFATGVLPFSRRIILGRPLVDGLPEDALRAIVAHELAHVRFRHPLLGYLASLTCAAAFGAGLRWLYRLPQSEESVAVGALIAAGGGAVLGALCFALVPGLLMRRLELAADRYAARLTGPDAVARALRWLDGATEGRLSRGSLSHPSLAQRLAAVRRGVDGHRGG